MTKEKKHNSAIEDDESNLKKKVLKKPVKTLVSCSDRFLSSIFYASLLNAFKNTCNTIQFFKKDALSNG